MSKKKGGARARIAALRNIGIIAHIDAGKTTLTERILFYTGKIHRMGEVHEGTATMDYLPEEQERGITITSACTTCLWKDHLVNIIDTPGHVDFTIEVERSLRVLDGAVGVFCAVGGVEPQSETVWRQSERYHVPKLAFVNKLDRPGADFESVLAQMRDKLGARPLPLTVPDGEGADLTGVFDVLALQRLEFDPQSFGEDIGVRALTPAELERVARWRDLLFDTLGEVDDVFLERYLGGEEISRADLDAAVRRATISRAVTPVLAGSALRNVGVQPLLEAVCAYLPSPLDVPPAVGIDPSSNSKLSFPVSASEPLSALAFKVTMETGRKLVLARLYSGCIEEGQLLYNATRDVEERAARLFHLHAGRKESLDQAVAGDIIAIAGLKHARTGDTLCVREHPILLERIEEYKPVISLAIEPKSSADTEKLELALDHYQQEDPTLHVERDEATGQLLISGMGELHLEVVLERLIREHGVSPRVGKPQVLYHETVMTEGGAEAEFRRDLGEARHHGALRLVVEPRARDAGNDVVFETDISFFPPAMVQAVEEGIQDGLQSGPLNGNPVQDVRVRVQELTRKEGESTPVGFRMAAFQALREALAAARPVLLEPIMWLEISVPDEFTGEVIGLLGSKGAKVENFLDRKGQKLVQALAPLRVMFGFSTELRSATQGRAGMLMKFSRFDVLV